MKSNTSKKQWSTPFWQIEEITATGATSKTSPSTREDRTYTS